MTEHPSEDDLIEFASGELPPGPETTIRRHLTGCEACRLTVLHYLSIIAAIPDPHSDGQCPSDGLLRQFSRGEMTGPERASIQVHLLACSRCAERLAELGGAAVVGDMAAVDDLALREAATEGLAKSCAEEVVKELLPASIDWLDHDWDDLASDSAAAAIALRSPPAMVAGGAFGFASRDDPERLAVARIALVMLELTRAISRGGLPQVGERLEDAIRDRAAAVGAGSQLQRRLSECGASVIRRGMVP